MMSIQHQMFGLEINISGYMSLTAERHKYVLKYAFMQLNIYSKGFRAASGCFYLKSSHRLNIEKEIVMNMSTCKK